MAPPLPDRNLIVARVIQMIDAGYTLAAIEGFAGMPSRQTLHRWMSGCETWRRQAEGARAAMRAGRRLAAEARDFDAERAEAFLAQVRLGYAVRALVRAPAWVNRARLTRWKAARPAFAAALAAAVAWGRATRVREARRQWRFDWATADRVLVRLAAGRTLADAVWADPALPGRHVLARWRRDEPEFAGAWRVCVLAGHRRRMRARRRSPQSVRDAVVGRLLEGWSLADVGRAAGMPHRATLSRWVREDAAFARAVADACCERERLLLEMAAEIAERATPATVWAARRAVGAVRRRLGQLRPWPGMRRRAAARAA